MSRYPCMLQDDSTDCGIACLVSVARYYRRRPLWSRVRAIASTGPEGTSLLGLSTAAAALGFNTRMIQAEAAELGTLPCPFIAHLRRDGFTHFVVVYHLRKGKITVADPAAGVRTEPIDAFLAGWSGAAMLVAPERPTPPELVGPSQFARFARLILPHKMLLAAAILGAAGLSALSYGNSFLFSRLVDRVFPSGSVSGLNLVGILALVLALVSALCTLVNGLVTASLGQRVSRDLMLSVLRRLFHLPLSYFESRKSGDIAHRFNSLLYVADSLVQVPVTIVLNAFLVLLSTGLLLSYNWRLALAMMCVLPLILPLTIGVRRRLQALYLEGLGAQGAVEAASVAALGAVAMIKAFGAEGHMTDKVEARVVRALDLERRTAVLSLFPRMVDGFAYSASVLMIYWIGGSMLMKGQATLGQLVFCVTLVGSMFPAFQALVSTSLYVQRVLANLERAADILDAETEPGHSGGLLPLGGFLGDITVEHVSFRYGRGRPVLSDVSFHVHPGECVAIVGESGSGKSTLLKLLQRLYDVEQGRILVDGIEIRNARLDAWRAALGVVDQECQLVPGTIQENLTLGGPALDPEELAHISGIAGLLDLIESHRERFEMKVGDQGGGMSGGEKQRLALARSLVRHPRVLLWDEATSHLDPLMEREIFETVMAEMSESTILMATHRTALARLADRVMVMADGRIIEEGTPQELEARGGAFARMCSGAPAVNAVIIEADALERAAGVPVRRFAGL